MFFTNTADNLESEHSKRFNLILTEGPKGRAHYGERSDHLLMDMDHRRPGVETYLRTRHDERMIGESFIDDRRILHNKNIVP